MTSEELLPILRKHCMAKDDVTEDYPWGETVWKVSGKMFANWAPGQTITCVKSTLDKQAVLIQHPNIEIAPYVGRYGWVTVRVTDADTLDLALELIDESYELAKPKRGRKKAAI